MVHRRHHDDLCERQKSQAGFCLPWGRPTCLSAAPMLPCSPLRGSARHRSDRQGRGWGCVGRDRSTSRCSTVSLPQHTALQHRGGGWGGGGGRRSAWRRGPRATARRRRKQHGVGRGARTAAAAQRTVHGEGDGGEGDQEGGGVDVDPRERRDRRRAAQDEHGRHDHWPETARRIRIMDIFPCDTNKQLRPSRSLARDRAAVAAGP